MNQMHNPPHPGAILADWLEGFDTSIGAFAKHIDVSRTTLSSIVNGHSGISPDMALRFAQALNTSPDVWIGMQKSYDLWHASQKARPAIAPLAEPCIEEMEMV